MAETSKAGKSGLTRGKAILIAALGIVLVGVLYSQFGGSGGDAAVAEPAGYKPRRAVVIAASAEATTAPNKEMKTGAQPGLVAGAATVDETRWKSPELADVVDYDPFALPPEFPKLQLVEEAAASGDDMVAAAAADDAQRLADAIDRLQQQLAELQQLGVQIVVRERDQYVAMVGDQTLHVGDEINGFIVTEIDPRDGVRVERKGVE
jgi:hypothetical protein